MHSEIVRLEGHIIDSLTLSRVLDLILLLGGAYDIAEFQVGQTRGQASMARIQVSAPTAELLDQILHEIGQHGAERTVRAVRTIPAPEDGVFPEGFYSTTNLRTAVYLEERWLAVDGCEMDCGIVISGAGPEARAICVPIHRIRRGDEIVAGDTGLRVEPLARVEPESAFHFMGSGASSERRKEIVVAAVARAVREARESGKRILFVGGPAIIHTGAGDELARLINAGWIDVLFAGNALATHDVEQAMFGTSLGVDLATGSPVSHGHEHHLRAINRVRAHGSLAAAVAAGAIRSGVMHACVTRGVRFVLAGSIRDDGPLPDVITDTVAAQEAMRREIENVGVAIMVATTLHAVATGNLLPAEVTTICVDSDADTVIKLLDRGSHQAHGLVTDCEFFLKELAARLLPT